MAKLYSRFSLRTFLIAISLAAILTSVWDNAARKQAKGVAWVASKGGHVTYAHEEPTANGSYPKGAKPPGPEWLRNLLGIHYFTSVREVTLDRDEINDLEPLKDLPKLNSLALMNFVHPETDWSHLTRLRHLDSLHVGYTGLDEDALQKLREMLPKCDVIKHE